MTRDDAFFARSRREEPLILEDPIDQPLMADVPSVLVKRALDQTGGRMFADTDGASSDATSDNIAYAQISVIRDGEVLDSVPVTLKI
jgi:hypothetical protein